MSEELQRKHFFKHKKELAQMTSVVRCNLFV